MWNWGASGGLQRKHHPSVICHLWYQPIEKPGPQFLQNATIPDTSTSGLGSYTYKPKTCMITWFRHMKPPHRQNAQTGYCIFLDAPWAHGLDLGFKGGLLACNISLQIHSLIKTKQNNEMLWGYYWEDFLFDYEV